MTNDKLQMINKYIKPKSLNYLLIKRFIWILILGFWISISVFSANAATLKKIRYKTYPFKIRVVFDLDGQTYYQVKKMDKGFTVRLFNCETENEEHRVYNVKDWVVRSLEVKKENKDIVVYFPLEYPVQYKVFPLGSPSRLVIDFGREFSRVESSKKIDDGLVYSYVTQGLKSGFVSAHVLLADPKKTEVFPALAMRSPDFFQSLMNVFTPWQKISRIHFFKDKVSSIVDKYNGIAGINGTYFSSTGRPLGVLVINQELISYPIHNRTALIIDENNKVSIDQVLLDGFVEIAGDRFEITGVNEPRDSNDVIIFTKHYGELTGTNRFGYELTVQDGKVTRGYVGNSRIPDNGFVVSFSPMFIEHVFSKVKKKDKVKIQMEMIPYSSRGSGNIRHVLGGGPRLIKKGKIYVSKNYEKFRPDIASGRAARTAVGVTKDNKIIMVTVDGKPRNRSPHERSKYAQSIGVTLEELARLMKSLGAVDALNLDGGGSTAMVINGKTINRPVNGSQRAVSNALLVRPLD